ncbi:MAG TPA: hypothetical protein VM265_06215 [Sphingomicrobium sp.]|nr:hypothetical protein [Sphingomicrobium sp.]
MLELPRRGGFAGAQPHHRVLDADRLARAHGKIANDAIALVEQPDHRDPLRHRRRSRLFGRGCRRRRARHRALLRRGARLGNRITAIAAVAGGGGKRRSQRADQPCAHVQSGVQG